MYILVAADVFKNVINDKATLGSLLGDLTHDIPAVILASAVGTAAGAAISGTAFGVAIGLGSFVMGPIIVAFGIGLAAGWGLNELNKKYDISAQLGRAYDEGLARLARVWDDLSEEAENRYNQLLRSRFVHDVDQNITWLSRNIGRQADAVGGRLASFW